LSGEQEIQGHPPIQPVKPKLSIRVPPRQHSHNQTQPSSDAGATMTSQALTASVSAPHTDSPCKYSFCYKLNLTCNSQGCDLELQPNAVSSRCFACVVKTWRKRNTEGSIISDASFNTQRKKSVSWADEVGGDLECIERRLEYGNSTDCVPPLPPSSAPLERPNDMDVDGHTTVEDVPPADLTPLSRDAARSPRLTQSMEQIIVEEELPAQNDKAFHLSESDPPPSHNPLSPNGDPPSSNNPCGDGPSATSGKSIFGWDSDLSELSDPSMDEGESESDSAYSEPISVRTFMLPFASRALPTQQRPSGLKIRIPPRPSGRSSGGDVQRCTNKHCQAPLSPDHRCKSYVPCRTHYRQYQRNRLGIQGKHPEDYSSSQSQGCIPFSTTVCVSHLPLQNVELIDIYIICSTFHLRS
jgi:hypothetical protein